MQYLPPPRPTLMGTYLFGASSLQAGIVLLHSGRFVAYNFWHGYEHGGALGHWYRRDDSVLLSGSGWDQTDCIRSDGGSFRLDLGLKVSFKGDVPVLSVPESGGQGIFRAGRRYTKAET